MPEAPKLTFGQNEVVEFETDDEDDEEEERPRIALGEDVDLGLSDDEKEPVETVALNI